MKWHHLTKRQVYICFIEENASTHESASSTSLIQSIWVRSKSDWSWRDPVFALIAPSMSDAATGNSQRLFCEHCK